MTDTKSAKEQNLIDALRAMPSCLIAFSGGLDSTYLGIMASKYVPDRVVCAIIDDASTPSGDLESAKKIASQHDLKLIIIKSEIHVDVRNNSRDRCYICKQCLFQKLEALRQKENLSAILDGENASDSLDDRPGSKAARELGIISPLMDASLTKDDIRELARAMDLEAWERPQSACLSSRVPFGTPIEDAVLKRVDKTEQFIRSKGIRMIRARVEGQGTRLELGQAENTPENRAMLKVLELEIKSLGWESVEIDLTGYVPAGLRRKNYGK
ncbi:MAG: ATP-dependent sacrificial sulfur transferase LarE [Thermoplasmata archaeon]|nr:ATP-dependent sacrificial sulfur transferase LarE [Thermoplasmata archaeon]